MELAIVLAAKGVVGYTAVALYGIWPWKKKTYDVQAEEDDETARAYEAYQQIQPHEHQQQQYQAPSPPSPPRLEEQNTVDITQSIKAQQRMTHTGQQVLLVIALATSVYGGGLNHYRRNGQQPRKMQAHSSVVNAINRNKQKLVREMAEQGWDKALYEEGKSVVDDESVLARLLMTKSSLADDEATSSQLLVDGQVIAGANKPQLPEEYFVLPIPTRPRWTRAMSKTTLAEREQDEFVAWRRKLAHIEDAYEAVLTPYEKSPFFWRQLWRVVERADVVVQVLDARDPLLYRSTPLEDFVSSCGDLGAGDDRDPQTTQASALDVDWGSGVSCRDSSAAKVNVVLLNKADLVPREARQAWAHYFESLGCTYFFFSALQTPEAAHAAPQSESGNATAADDAPEDEEGAAAVLGRSELLERLRSIGAGRRSRAAAGESARDAARRIVISFVGFPNVGKSSVLNSLTSAFEGVKRVAQAASPGKTKHLQTLLVGDDICLCDCPGLVFPSVVSSRAEMVCAGMLNIHQVRDVLAPIQLVCDRVRKQVLEALYGIQVQTKRVVQRGSTDPLGMMRAARLQRLGGPAPTTTATIADKYLAADLLFAYCQKRSMVQQKSGNADFNRAARVMLKDFVGGVIPHWREPPEVF